MKPSLSIYLIATLFVVFFVTTNLFAQWTNVAPNLLGNTYALGGAMTFQSGVLWCGEIELYRSLDSGKTWTNVNSLHPASIVYDINFFDANNGIVTCSGGEVYITHNGGASWAAAPIPPASRSYAYTGFFIGSANTIAVSENTQGLFISRDGGISWTQSGVGGASAKTFGRGVRGGTAYILMFDPSGLIYSRLWVTSDYGVTWTPTNGTTNIDCWSFCVDKCDSNTIYLVNEAGVISTDGFSDLIVSTDLGTSWNVTLSKPFSYITGSITNHFSSVYAQSNKGGVLRSIDHGKTWKDIGGPRIGYDSRLLTAINDNIVAAVDSFGSIYVTYNSGGDSLAVPDIGYGTLALERDTLFNSDTLFLCDPPRARSIAFKRLGCNPPNPQVVGLSNGHYYTTTITHDSLSVTFVPSGIHAGIDSVVITNSDGTSEIVYLFGVIRDSKPLKIITADQATDTIGGDVRVPISLAGLDKPHTVELVVHYDTTLVYRNSVSLTGAVLDLANEQWPGRSKIQIPGATSPGIAAYSNFNVFVDSAGKTHVRFDSLVVIDESPPCEYAGVESIAAAASTITEATGCGNQLISVYMRTGWVAAVSIRPNPASNKIILESSEDIPDAHIAITDEIGNARQILSAGLKKTSPTELDLSSLAEGMYVLSISAGGHTTSSTFVIRR